MTKRRRNDSLDVADLTAYVLFNIAEKIGIREDLFCSLGGDSEAILACGIEQVLAGDSNRITSMCVDRRETGSSQ